MEAINIYLVIYALVLFIIFIWLALELRKVKRNGDERQIAIFYRASYDGMLGGIFGFVVFVLFRALIKFFDIPKIYFGWMPSPIVIAIVTMYISYRIRIK
ncbi:hypothetical protein DRQ36_01280 [bacterium]|nr:MAG: hypothetical protein DRQ36_01280 [bacterium]